MIGDLGPSLVSEIFGVENGPPLRAFVMTFLGMFIALPLALLRHVESLSSFSALSLGLYSILIIKLFSDASENMFYRDDAWDHIIYWDVSNVWNSLPIFSMSLSCQTQLFEIFDATSLSDLSSLKKMNHVVSNAINICSLVYVTVGLFGYIAFYQLPFRGNILVFLPSGFISTLTQAFFIFTIVISVPICLFPCRTSLHSFLFRKGSGGLLQDISVPTGSIYMSDRHFKLLTIALIITTIGISVLLPHIEMVLGILGATIGTTICFIFPAVVFISLTNKNTNERVLAHIVAFIGIFILVVCSHSTLQNAFLKNDEAIIENLKMKEVKGGKEEKAEVKQFVKSNNDHNVPNLHPDAIKKEEKEIMQGANHQSNNVDVVKPITDQNKAKRQEELLQRLEKQQQEHKKLLEQQKVLLSEMQKHENIHHEQEVQLANMLNSSSASQKKEQAVLLSESNRNKSSVNIPQIKPLDKREKLSDVKRSGDQDQKLKSPPKSVPKLQRNLPSNLSINDLKLRNESGAPKPSLGKQIDNTLNKSQTDLKRSALRA